MPEGTLAVLEMGGLFWANNYRKHVKGCLPQMSFLQRFAEHYPHAHFILNIRDNAEWVKVINNHNDLRERLAAADLPGLPKGAGLNNDDLTKWAQAHNGRVQAELNFYGRRLLTFDVDRHGTTELSNFLGFPVQWAYNGK